jgi:GGDEF domain-containing protein
MISIKKYLSGKYSDSSGAFEQMAHLLLEAIGQSAVRCDRDDYDGFRSEIIAVGAKLKEDPSPANILVSTHGAIQALEEYNRRTSQIIRAKRTELQSIVGMLAQATAQISTGSETAITRLRDMQKQIEHASMLDDIRSLRSRLSECLDSIRSESVRHRDEAARVTAELDQGLRKTRETVATVERGEADRLTGIALRPRAEQAIQAACQAGEHCYAGLFILDRIQAISSRFGSALVDQVVLFFLQHLSQGLTSQDQIFRWGPDAFLALLERDDTAENVRREVGKVLSRPIEPTFTVSDHSVVVPIASIWVIVPVFNSTVTEVVHKLEVFTSGALG